MIGIKNFNMPESCYDCPLCYDLQECVVSDLKFWHGSKELKEFSFSRERHPKCPLFTIEKGGYKND